MADEPTVGQVPETEELDGQPSPEAFQRSMQRLIEQEVRNKRRQGVLLPSYEAELRSIYENLLPKGSKKSAADFDHLMYTVDRSAVINIDVPLRSQIFGVTYLKTALRKLMAWYLNYVVQQLSNFHANLSQLLHATDLRLSQVESRLETLVLSRPSGEIELSSAGLDKIASHEGLEGVSRRVLVLSCTANGLIAELSKRDLDVYGVDSDVDRLDEMTRMGLDVRWEPISEHLEHLRAGSLGGVVVQGEFELISQADKVRGLQALYDALAPGATMYLMGHDPSVAPRASSQIIAQDLAPGKPFHWETWEFLARSLGFCDIAHEQLPTGTNRKPTTFLVTARKGAE